MQLALHAKCRAPHGALRLVEATFSRSVRTRRVPSRHCRDARVYGHATMVMPDMSTPPPSPPRAPSLPAPVRLLAASGHGQQGGIVRGGGPRGRSTGAFGSRDLLHRRVRQDGVRPPRAAGGHGTTADLHREGRCGGVCYDMGIYRFMANLFFD